MERNTTRMRSRFLFIGLAFYEFGDMLFGAEDVESEGQRRNIYRLTVAYIVFAHQSAIDGEDRKLMDLFIGELDGDLLRGGVGEETDVALSSLVDGLDGGTAEGDATDVVDGEALFGGDGALAQDEGGAIEIEASRCLDGVFVGGAVGKGDRGNGLCLKPTAEAYEQDCEECFSHG